MPDQPRPFRPPSVTAGPSSPWRRWLRRLSGIPTPAIFGFCLVVAILVLWWQGAIGGFVDLFVDADWRLLFLAVPIYLFSLWLLCYRWHVLVRMAHGGSSLLRAAEAFLTSVVINYAAPVGLAVPSRAALTKRALGLTVAETGIIALWEIGADVIVLGAGTVIWLVLADGAVATVRQEADLSVLDVSLVVFGLMTAVVAGLILLRARPRWRQKLGSIVRTLLLAPRQRPAAAAACLLISTAYWILQGVVLALIIAALGVAVSFELMLGLVSLPILVGMLSPIPGGAAVREGLMYAVAGLSDAPASEILAAAIIYRLALFGAIPILYALVRVWIGSRPRDAPGYPANAGRENEDNTAGTIRPSR